MNRSTATWSAIPAHIDSGLRLLMSNVTFSTVDYDQGKADLLVIRNANRDTTRDAAYMAWRYLDRPTKLPPLVVFAETSAGRKIGSLSVIPHEYAIDNITIPVGILGDISVEKTWRGKGIAEQMIQFLSGLEAFQRMAAGIVLPNEAAARPLQKCGWRTVATLRRYVRVLDIEALLRQRFNAKWPLAPLARLANNLLRLCSAESYFKGLSGHTWEITDHFDDRFDHLWHEVNKTGTIVGLRNKDYLSWRYTNHPTENYQVFLLLRQSRLCGYVVFHINGNRCYIDDLLSANGDSSCAHLLFHFLQYVRGEKMATSISMMTNEHNKLARILRKFGFHKRPDYLKLMVSIYEPHPRAGLLTNRAAWFLTAGDKDV
jgi:RimJ/RimL family protein N-acetyltransferase